MKKLILAAVMVIMGVLPLAAAENHAGHGMNFLGNTPGRNAHEEVIDGVKATFNISTMKEAMASMKMELPKGIKETHHIAVSFNDAKTGKPVEQGEVRVKIQSPDKTEQTRDLQMMHGHFGADFELAKKGKYGVMCRFKLPDGKVRSAKFWYEVR